MIKRFLYLNGLAILAVIVFHAGGWGQTAMFAWSNQYLTQGGTSISQIGSPQYYFLRVIEQIAFFSIPAFLFVSGYFVAFKSSNQPARMQWKSIINRTKFLLIPYLLWTTIYLIFNLMQGKSSSPLEILVFYLTGSITPAYYFVILLIQLYLLSPLLIEFARKNWKLLLLFTGLLQLGIDLIPYMIIFFPKDAAIVLFVRAIPKWLFIARLFWFCLGIVIYVNREAFQSFCLSKRKLWFVLAIGFLSISLVEKEILLHLVGADWLGTRETVFNAFYAIAILFWILSLNGNLPQKNWVEKVGTQSFGIYLAHVPVMELTARLIYHFMPQLLSMTILFTIIMAVTGLFIPLLLMKLVKPSPLKRVYGYVFG